MWHSPWLLRQACKGSLLWASMGNKAPYLVTPWCRMQGCGGSKHIWVLLTLAPRKTFWVPRSQTESNLQVQNTNIHVLKTTVVFKEESPLATQTTKLHTREGHITYLEFTVGWEQAPNSAGLYGMSQSCTKRHLTLAWGPSKYMFLTAKLSQLANTYIIISLWEARLKFRNST